MSKTWKTRPYDVQLTDHQHGLAQINEYHNHALAPCSLPETPLAQLKMEKRGEQPANCWWTGDWAGKNLCGCARCTDKYGRKGERKRERAGKRKVIREQLLD